MDHSASPTRPARRTGTIVLLGLAILGAGIAALLAGSLAASAPFRASSSWVEAARPTGTQAAPDAADGVTIDGAVADGVVDAADGVVPDWVAVSVFDEDVPAVGNLDPALLDALHRAATASSADGIGLRVNSGWRSPEYQQQLLVEAVLEHGSPQEAARWVATPDTSAHVSGDAVDIGPPDAAAWLSEHGAATGLCPIYRNEPWHFELRPDAVDDGCPPMYANPTEDPRMQP